MADPLQEHRFTEGEFALILRRATELDASSQVEPSPGVPPIHHPEGLTLREIQDIAADVGVDPARVVQAVDSLAAEKVSDAARFFGGPLRIQARRTLLREMTPLEMGRLLDVVREGLGSQGEAHEVLGGVEWRGTRSGDPVLARIVPERGRTVVHMTVRRGTSAFVGHWLPFLGVGGATGVLIGALQPLDPGAVAGILAVAAAVTYGLGRTIWTAGTRQWRRLLDRVADEIVRAGERP